MPWRRTPRTARRLASETGCPPPLLLVIVTNTHRHVVRPLAEQRVQCGDVHVALERMAARGVVSFGDHEVDGLGTGGLDVGSGGVEVGVVRHDLAGPADDAEQDPLGGPPWWVGMTCSKGTARARRRRTGSTTASRRTTRRRAGSRPTGRGSSRRSRVGEQIDQHVARRELEQVVAGPATAARAPRAVVIRIGSTEWIRNGSTIVRKVGALMPATVLVGRTQANGAATHDPGVGPRERLPVRPARHRSRSRPRHRHVKEAEVLQHPDVFNMKRRRVQTGGLSHAGEMALPTHVDRVTRFAGADPGPRWAVRGAARRRRRGGRRGRARAVGLRRDRLRGGRDAALQPIRSAMSRS